MKNLIIIITFISCTAPKSSLENSKFNEKNFNEQNSKELGSIKDCICPQLWMPVCGDDGKTYSNACFAKCSNTKYTPGSCEKYFE